MSSAEDIIGYLNARAGRHFKISSSNGRMVKRILEDHSADEVKLVIEAKVASWLGDPQMEKYLRPATLFSKRNFKRYIEEVKPEKSEALSHRQIEHRIYLQSKEWQEKRRAVVERAMHRCEGCGIYLGEKGQVHHLTYAHWKDEFLFELIYVCSDCHNRLHNMEVKK
jgi:uncharacterized phage protein (TIGR02220 family)